MGFLFVLRPSMMNPFPLLLPSISGWNLNTSLEVVVVFISLESDLTLLDLFYYLKKKKNNKKK